MGHDHQRLAARGQVVRQPVDALDVEVVGGLVEHQQVVLADQQPGPARPAGARRRTAARPPGRAWRRGRPGRRTGRSSTSRTRGSRGPLVRRPVADDQRARTVAVGSRSSRWPTHGHPQAARVGHPAGVRRLAPGEQPQQGRLAVAVAPDDADAVALADAEGHVVEQVAGAVRLATPSRLTRLRATQPSPTTRAPATGPCARRTDRQVPVALSATAMSIACSGLRARKTMLGPLPETRLPRAPAWAPVSSVSRSAGRSEQAAACRSLCRAAPSASASPVRRARHQRVGDPRLAAPGCRL